MATMDIFNQNAFSMVSMTQALERAPYVPQFLGSLPIFEPVPISTVSIMIEERDGQLVLIQTSPRGAPPSQETVEKRTARSFSTVRIARDSTIQAYELQGIRAFGTESELMQVQREVARRLNGPWGLRAKVELTHENMRLGAVQGVVKDADGSTIIDWYSGFGLSSDAEIDFDLDAASPAAGVLRNKCDQTVRRMIRQAKGAWTPQTYPMALCGDNFWDNLTAHTEVRATYLNYQAAAELRQGTAFGQFPFGGITWVNYRGTDDGSTVGVHTDKCKIFPVNAPGIFQVAWAPHDSFEYVNTPGLPVYAMIVPDRNRNMWAKVEVYSYPLHICTRPEVLQSGKRT